DRLGSLTAAADVLCLTQSALSHSIKKLERQAGAPLWLRAGRNLRLTQAGQDLLALARRVLPQFERAEARLREFARGERGTLRICMECHPCYQSMPRASATYLAAWRSVNADVKKEFQSGGVVTLFAWEIDLLLQHDPLYLLGPSYAPLFDYEQVFVVARHHPLAPVSH